MFFYISKILDFIINPLVWVLVLMLLSLIRKSKRRKFIFSSTLVLIVFSNSIIFFEVMREYEVDAVEQTSLKESYEAAIILGGMIKMDEENNLIAFEGSSDRFLAILPLYFNKKVKKLIISGGSGRLFQDEKEAELLKRYLLQIGVKEKDILIETKSKNTYENAKYTADLIRTEKLKGPFLLSTSASHIYRSELCFIKQGVAIDLYPVDHYAIDREINPETIFVPNPDVLKEWKWLLHEWMGLIAYKLNGYI